MKKLCFTFLFLLGLLANAQERVFMFEREKPSAKEYIYPATIQPTDVFGHTSAWFEEEYNSLQKSPVSGKLFIKKMVQYEINCKDKELGIKAITLYSKDGNSIDSVNNKSYQIEMMSVSPNSYGWLYVETVCLIAEQKKTNY